MGFKKIDINNVFEYVRDFFTTMNDRNRDEIEVEAMEEQMREDAMRATMAFLELKQNDGKIYELLQKYFDINNIRKANNIIKDAKVERQIDFLVNYLRKNNMRPDEVEYYLEKYDVYNKLRDNDRLLNMPVEKLKREIEKG